MEMGGGVPLAFDLASYQALPSGACARPPAVLLHRESEGRPDSAESLQDGREHGVAE